MSSKETRINKWLSTYTWLKWLFEFIPFSKLANTVDTVDRYSLSKQWSTKYYGNWAVCAWQQRLKNQRKVTHLSGLWSLY